MTNINEYLNKENLSTIAVWIFTIIAPYISAYITQETFTTLFVALIGICLAVYSSKNPNNLEILGNQNNTTCVCDGTEPLNPEYDSGDGA